MAAAFLTSLTMAIAALAAMGTDQHGLSFALRLTGRLTFLLFWPAYAGSAMAAEFGARFGILRRHAREFGLAFASAQLVHFALVAWIIWASHEPISDGVMPFFAVGIVWTYVLALSSAERFYNMLSPDLWRMLRTVGLEYIALVFFTDFVILPVQNQAVEHPMAYLPFSMMIIVGPLLRWWRSLDPRRLLCSIRSAPRRVPR